MYNNQYDFNNYQYPLEYQEDRFLFTPFLVGGLAGTALGLGIANNNQINNNYYGDFNVGDTDFNDLIAIFTTFMGTIMGFLSVLPLWLTSLIVLGITAAIILRIGGR